MNEHLTSTIPNNAIAHGPAKLKHKIEFQVANQLSHLTAVSNLAACAKYKLWICILLSRAAAKEEANVIPNRKDRALKHNVSPTLQRRISRRPAAKAETYA